MNRLKIIIEQTGTVEKPEYACLYVGEDGQKAAAILAEPSPNRRAEYRPGPIRFNSSSRIIEEATPAKPAAKPVIQSDVVAAEPPPVPITGNTLGTLKPESKKKSSK
jgi:hypothetical protein